jgi:hypothetical protein
MGSPKHSFPTNINLDPEASTTAQPEGRSDTLQNEFLGQSGAATFTYLDMPEFGIDLDPETALAAQSDDRQRNETQDETTTMTAIQMWHSNVRIPDALLRPSS